MLMPKEKPSIPFDPLPIDLLTRGNTLFPDSCLSIITLPLSNIKKHIKTQWLHGEELTILNKFSYEKRYKEWLGGRICSKQSLHNYLEQHNFLDTRFNPRQYIIASEESGKPFILGSEKSDFSFPELSISHSKEFATAMVSKTSCGIDIQYPAENLFRVKMRFISENEELLLQEALPQLSALQHLTLLWAGKEAVKKMLSSEGIPGFNELTLVNITSHGVSTAIFSFSTTRQAPFPVIAAILDNNYGLAFCCKTLNPSHSI